MNAVTDAVGLEQRPKGIICVEISGELFERVREALDASPNPSQFFLARSPKASVDILAMCRRLAPALVIVEDSKIPALPLKQMSDLINRRSIRILVISDDTSDVAHEHFFHRGCSGMLASDTAARTIRMSIDAIFAGELWMPRRVLSKLVQDAFVSSSVKKLTRREVEILKLISRGLTNQQIANQLFISRETVRWHVRSVYSKIGVDSRPGAIRYSQSQPVESEPFDSSSPK